MAQDLFRVDLGFADNNISYLSGSGSPLGAAADEAGIGSKWTDISTGDTYSKTSMPSTWAMMATGGSTAAIQAEINIIESSVGLNIDGTRTWYGTPGNFLSGDSIKTAVEKVDVATTAAKNKADLAQSNLDAFILTHAGFEAAQSSAIADKVAKAGDTMTGNLAFGGVATVTGLTEPVNSSDAATKNYVDNRLTGITWKEPVDSVGTSLPGTATTGQRFLNFTDSKIYTATAPDTWNSGVTPIDNWAVFDKATDQGYTFNGTDWVQFTGAGQIDAGIGLSRTGNTINVNPGAGVAQLPTDEIGIDVRSNSGLFLTEDGTTSSTGTNAQLALKLDGTSLVTSANGVKVSDGITSAVSANTAAIAQEILDRAAADTTIHNVLDPLNTIVTTKAYRQQTGAAITAATVIDTSPVNTSPVVKWLVYVQGLNADAGKFQAIEVLALNNSTGGVASAIDFTSYAKLRIGANISGLTITVDLNAGGTLMQLKVASTAGVNAWVVGTDLSKT